MRQSLQKRSSTRVIQKVWYSFLCRWKWWIQRWPWHMPGDDRSQAVKHHMAGGSIWVLHQLWALPVSFDSIHLHPDGFIYREVHGGCWLWLENGQLDCVTGSKRLSCPRGGSLMHCHSLEQNGISCHQYPPYNALYAKTSVWRTKAVMAQHR